MLCVPWVLFSFPFLARLVCTSCPCRRMEASRGYSLSCPITVKPQLHGLANHSIVQNVLVLQHMVPWKGLRNLYFCNHKHKQPVKHVFPLCSIFFPQPTLLLQKLCYKSHFVLCNSVLTLCNPVSAMKPSLCGISSGRGQRAGYPLYVQVASACTDPLRF